MPDATIRVVWLALLVQFFVGGAVLGIFTSVSFLSLSGENYDGLLSLVGSALFGSVTAGLAMVLAFVIGLPLRLVRVLRWWWVTRGWVIAIILAVVGLLGLSLAFTVPAPAVGSAPQGSNFVLYFSSMGVAALGLCHLMRPMKMVPLPVV